MTSYMTYGYGTCHIPYLVLIHATSGIPWPRVRQAAPPEAGPDRWPLGSTFLEVVHRWLLMLVMATSILETPSNRSIKAIKEGADPLYQTDQYKSDTNKGERMEGDSTIALG